MSSKRIPITAKYQGKTGPHGYLQGEVYTVYLYPMANNMIVVYPFETAIDKAMCGYDDWLSFLTNWAEVTAILPLTP